MRGSWGVDKQLSAPFVLLGLSCCVSRLRRPGLSQQDKQLSMGCYGSLRGPKAAGGVGTNSYPWSRKSPGPGLCRGGAIGQTVIHEAERVSGGLMSCCDAGTNCYP